MKTKKNGARSGEMTQPIKVLAALPDNVSSILGTHKMGGEN